MSDPKDFSKNPGDNSTVDGISIAEGSASAQLNDAIRAVLAVLAAPSDYGAAANAMLIDFISESTLDAGVTIDGLLIKDGGLPNIPSSVPTGIIFEYTSLTPPSGFLLADGAAVSRTTYADLYAVTGDTYGAGDGTTTFNLPNRTRNVAVGVGGTGTAVLGNLLGDTGGSETHTQTIAEMPAHTHTTSASFTQRNTDNNGGFGVTSGGGSESSSTGGGDPFNIMQPAIVQAFIIKT